METLSLALDYLLQYSYWGVVVLILAFSFVLPLSKTLVIVGAGVLASEGYGNAYIYFVISLATMLFADSVYYSLGRILGGRIENLDFYRNHQAQFNLASERFAQHAWVTVMFSRFLPYLRVFIYIVSGMNKMPYISFLSADFTSSFFYTLASIMLGYYLAENRQALVAHVHDVEFYSTIIVVVLLLGYLIYRRRRQLKGIKD